MYNPKDNVLMMSPADPKKMPEGKKKAKAKWVKFCAGCGSQYTDMRDLKDHVKSDDRCPLTEG